MTKPLKIDFGDEHEPQHHYINHEKIITDRRSVYSVSMGHIHNKQDIKKFLNKTKRLKNHNTATHHSWAVRISHGGAIFESKNDGGETGAGQIILGILQKKHMINAIICVTRWYGGIKLAADRFRHINDATVYVINYQKK